MVKPRGKNALKKGVSQNLQGEKLAYACLLDYFDLSLDNSDFYKLKARKIYGDKMPRIAHISVD